MTAADGDLIVGFQFIQKALHLSGVDSCFLRKSPTACYELARLDRGHSAVKAGFARREFR